MLSVLSGVGGYGCPVSISVCLIGIALFAFMNNSATPTSAADTITFLMIVAKMYI